ncbi:predicted protein [Lichtheimia corymbifera JMRC:FSU:9682]|uniref:DUF1764-domain-containing protein n=1 Tax=Lichtheimia corymbifera JMRC:FSU:9682 TaxID=1263082 RepID=A0A068RPV1_9FUNG|nr:predicted protein [Lichtheimia corymbifera JMRC:FSU:9682]
MVKEKKKDTTITTTAKKAKSNSEIDDIFATKKLPKDDKSVEQESAKNKNKKDKKKKEKEDSDDKEKQEDQENKVEEVVFAELASVKKGIKRQQPPAPPEDDDSFGDSRGKKAKRTTEDGYPLYDVKDLRIGEGKDTPQCPFDCDCCY